MVGTTMVGGTTTTVGTTTIVGVRCRGDDRAGPRPIAAFGEFAGELVQLDSEIAHARGELGRAE
jgi:hypothetical protein